jgi:hypothetical protein
VTGKANGIRTSTGRRVTIFVVLALAIATLATAQWGRRWAPPRFPEPGFHPNGFAFGRLMYRQVTREELGHGWNTDYPDSDQNMMIRLSELTRAHVRLDQATGAPDHYVVTADSPLIFSLPFLFMSDAGTVGFDEVEAANLREYLMRGGLLYADDFWGDSAWYHFADEIAKVLPPEEYPLVDIPLEHPILHQLFDIDAIPQVPSIQFWSWGQGTSELGAESAEPHFRGIFDATGRILVLATHNTDIADGWEREGQSEEFFELFSLPASYPMGLNILIYALSH